MRSTLFIRTTVATIAVLFVSFPPLHAQEQDSARKVVTLSGSIGFSTNGFSIIPTFSLNSPALLSFISSRRNRFSIDSDIRLTPDLKRGSAILWFRFYPVEKQKIQVRLGVHPALNFQSRQLQENSQLTTISQMRRFLAWEVNTSYRWKNNRSVSLYYLQSNGLQKDGPRTAHFINLTTSYTGLRLSNSLRFAIHPSVYYLYLDKHSGTYFTAAAAITHKKIPLSLESMINKNFQSSIPGNKEFMWCLMLKYNFNHKLVNLK